MPSEASRKKARETCDHDHNTVGCWTCGTLQPCKPCEAIAAALDEARAEGEKEASAAYKKGYIRGLTEGAERERWECCESAARFGRIYGCNWPEEEAMNCGGSIVECGCTWRDGVHDSRREAYCMKHAQWCPKSSPMRGPEEEK